MILLEAAGGRAAVQNFELSFTASSLKSLYIILSLLYLWLIWKGACLCWGIFYILEFVEVPR